MEYCAWGIGFGTLIMLSNTLLNLVEAIVYDNANIKVSLLSSVSVCVTLIFFQSYCYLPTKSSIISAY